MLLFTSTCKRECHQDKLHESPQNGNPGCPRLIYQHKQQGCLKRSSSETATTERPKGQPLVEVVFHLASAMASHA